MNRPVFNALFLFLLPALLAASIIGIVNLLSNQHIHTQQNENMAYTRHNLSTLNRMIQLVAELGQLHSDVSQQLYDAQNAQLNEAQAYHIHVQVIDHSAAIADKLTQLIPALSQYLSTEQINQWQQAVMDYRNIAMMATDIAAIEPKVAGQYIQQAQLLFFNLSSDTVNLIAQLSTDQQNDIQHTQQTLQQLLNQNNLISFAAFVLALLLAIISAHYLSRQLQTIMISTKRLTEQPLPENLPQVHQLAHSSSREVRQLAATLLNLHQALNERQQQAQRIEQLLLFDTLTGLPNRNHVLQTLSERHTISPDKTYAFILLNINRFKTLNDGLGYHLANELLIAIAHRLQALPALLVARMTGDEFAIISHAIASPHESSELQQLLHAIQQCLAPPFTLRTQTIKLRIALGATYIPAQASLTANDTITQATQALHAAKAHISTPYVVYHQALENTAKTQIRLENKLNNAIDNNQLSLYLQPQVDANGNIYSAEVLTRWHDPDEGNISPATFIPIAEQSGLIIPLDQWVLAQTCQWLTRFRQHLPNFTLAVNISAIHFALPNFVTQLTELLTRTNTDPHGLILEITESVMIDDIQDVIDKMQQLNRIGIRFSLDDFGTGYSSLQYLKHLPLYELKIDKHFIDQLPHQHDDVAMLNSIVTMAHNLHLQLIIEGVEHQAQVDYLTTLGNMHFQGYYFSQPIPAQQLYTQLIPS